MKKKLIKRRIYKVGSPAFFNSWYDDGRDQEIIGGEITKVSTKFCTINVNGKEMRKAKHNIYFSEDDLKLKILQ